MRGVVPNYKSVILRQHLEEIRFRMLAMSNVNLQADRDMIDALRHQAHDIGDTDLELYALSNYGLAFLGFGELERAYALFAEGVELSKTYQNEERWLVFRLNQGVTLMMQRHLSAARTLLEDFLPRLKTAPVNAENSARLYLTCCYLSLICVDLYDYAAAETYARAFLDRWESAEFALIPQVRRVEMMSMARDALASVQLSRKEYSHARSQANLMLGISVRQVYPLQTISAYVALLRVSVFSSSGHDAEADWQRVKQACAPLIETRAPVLWRLATQILLRDAVMYRDQRQFNWARRCAEKAVEMLAVGAADDHRQRAEAFLAELPNP